MKKFLFIISAGFICLLTSCDSKKEAGMSEKAQKNLDAVHGVNHAFDTKDFSKLGDYIAEDCIDHAGETGDIKGLANMKAEFEKMIATQENAKTETIKELADDDYAMAWQRYTGTLKVDQMGKKAGDKYDMTAVEVVKFKDGKAIEHWSFMQPADMMKMMPQPPAMDTTNKMN